MALLEGMRGRRSERAAGTVCKPARKTASDPDRSLCTASCICLHQENPGWVSNKPKVNQESQSRKSKSHKVGSAISVVPVVLVLHLGAALQESVG